MISGVGLPRQLLYKQDKKQLARSITKINRTVFLRRGADGQDKMMMFTRHFRLHLSKTIRVMAGTWGQYMIYSNGTQTDFCCF